MPNMNEPGATLVFVVTIALSLLGFFRSPQLIDACLFRPYYFLRRQQYLTILSSGFVHADLGHLLFNMFTFYFFAFPIERLFGTGYFLALYLFGLLVSHGCTWFKHRGHSLSSCQSSTNRFRTRQSVRKAKRPMPDKLRRSTRSRYRPASQNGAQGHCRFDTLLDAPRRKVTSSSMK